MTKVRGKLGVLGQREADHVTLRLLVHPAGKVDAHQLRKAAEIAEKNGKGFVYITMRKGIEIPWIRFEDHAEVLKELKTAGLYAGSCGTRVRGIVACGGSNRCAYCLADVETLCSRLMEKFYEKEVPAKFKIAIAGCPNYCSNPTINDFGIVASERPRIESDKCINCGICVRMCRGKAIYENGQRAPVIDYDKCLDCGWCIKNCPSGAIAVEKTGYTITVGGRSGRDPKLGVVLAKLLSEEELFRVLAKTFAYFQEHAVGRERFTNVLQRKGLEHYSRYVLDGIGNRRSEPWAKAMVSRS